MRCSTCNTQRSLSSGCGNAANFITHCIMTLPSTRKAHCSHCPCKSESGGSTFLTSLCRLSAGTAAAQVMSFVRAIAAAAPRSHAALLCPARWQRLWNGRLVEDVRSAGGRPAPESQLQDAGLSEGEAHDDFDAVEMD